MVEHNYCKELIIYIFAYHIIKFVKGVSIKKIHYVRQSFQASVIDSLNKDRSFGISSS